MKYIIYELYVKVQTLSLKREGANEELKTPFSAFCLSFYLRFCDIVRSRDSSRSGNLLNVNVRSNFGDTGYVDNEKT